MGQKSARLTIALGTTLFALLLGLAIEAAYDSSFVHDRYWGGTIARVQLKDAALVSGFLQAPAVAEAVAEDPQLLWAALEPIRNNMAIRISRGDTELFNSAQGKRVVDDLILEESLPGGIELQIRRYESPPWSTHFFEWLTTPTEWFSPRFDSRTLPFFFFSAMTLSFSWILIWRHRAKHVEEQVIPLLKRLDEDE